MIPPENGRPVARDSDILDHGVIQPIYVGEIESRILIHGPLGMVPGCLDPEVSDTDIRRGVENLDLKSVAIIPVIRPLRDHEERDGTHNQNGDRADRE